MPSGLTRKCYLDVSDHLEPGMAALYRKIIGKRSLPVPGSAVSPISAGPVPPCITAALHPRLHQLHAGRVRLDADPWPRSWRCAPRAPLRARWSPPSGF